MGCVRAGVGRVHFKKRIEVDPEILKEQERGFGNRVNGTVRKCVNL